MTRVMGGGTVADRDETRTIAETVSLGTASAIAIVPITRTIIGGDDTQPLAETLISIGELELTGGDTKTETILIRAPQLGRAAFLDTVEARFV